MTYTTQPIARRPMPIPQFMMMMLAALVLVFVMSSSARGQWTNTTPNINNTNTGNVGIGTSTPSEKLEVNGTVKSGGLTITGAPSEPSYVNALFLGMNGTTATIDAVNQMVDFRDLVITDKTLHVRSWNGGGFVTGLFQNNAGNVGIRTTTPLYSLDVNGGTNGFRAKAASTSSSDTIATFENSSGIQAIIRANGNVGIGTTTPSDLMQVDTAAGWGLRIRYTGDGQYLRFSSNQISSFTSAGAGRDLYLNTAGGSVGIGTITPNKSSVSRALTINGSTDAIYELAISDARVGTMYHNGSTLSITNNANGALTLGTNNSERVRIDASGNVGIGTLTPSATLHVQGTGRITGSLTVDGTLNAKYQDMAEWVQSSQQLSAGTVVVLDHTKSNQVIASSQAYDTRVAGVISLQPGITLGEDGAGKVLVATTGRVKVRVDASAGPIQVGDLLVTSDKEGIAKKSEPLNLGGVAIHRPGTLIGKALEPLDKGTGEILVLLSLQ